MGVGAPHMTWTSVRLQSSTYTGCQALVGGTLRHCTHTAPHTSAPSLTGYQQAMYGTANVRRPKYVKYQVMSAGARGKAQAEAPPCANDHRVCLPIWACMLQQSTCCPHVYAQALSYGYLTMVRQLAPLDWACALPCSRPCMARTAPKGVSIRVPAAALS